MNSTKTIEWQSDRIDDYIICKLEDIKMNLAKLALCESYDLKLGKVDAHDINTIVYDNTAVKSPYGGISHLSIGATAVLMASFGEFPIPPEVAEYIKMRWEDENVNTDNFPTSAELYEKGKAIVEAFLENDIPYYAAVALTGACFIECAWDVHVYNKLEKDGGGVGGTNGWAGCGEGLFGLTFWTQKEKIIKKLGLNSAWKSAEAYNNSNSHLCDEDEETWIEILMTYLELCAKKQYDVLGDEDADYNDQETQAKTLFSSYLWKAGQGVDPDFDGMKKTAERYMNTHKKQSSNPRYKPIDGFAQQVCISILLDQYLHNEKSPNFDCIGIDYGIDIDGTAFGSGSWISDIGLRRGGSSRGNSSRRMNKEDRNRAKGKGGSKGEEKLTQEQINKQIGQQGNYDTDTNIVDTWNGENQNEETVFDAYNAARYMLANSSASSQHACAKYVRLGLMHGGIKMQSWPNWAFKYDAEKFLNKFGFKHIATIAYKDQKLFKPLIGDVAVYKKGENDKVPGHICMWTGTCWCSDFRQNNMILYGGLQKYAKVYRFAGKKKINEKDIIV